MSLSMYQASIPVFQRGLGAMSRYLDRAVAFTAEKGLASDALTGARLAPDMLTLIGQVQRASDTSKASVGRLIGVTAPAFADDEVTLADLQARVARTTAYFDTVDPAAFEGSEERSIALNFGKLQTTMRGDDYLLRFALPNFYFHVATAHAILRNQGLPVGKTDFIGAIS